MRLEASIQEIKGIGEKTKQLFAKIGVYTAGDILLHFPRTYQQFPEPLASGEAAGEGESACAIRGILRQVPLVRRGKRMEITVATAYRQEAEPVELIWYRMPYLRSQLKPKIPYIFYGKLLTEKGRQKMEQCAVYNEGQYAALRESLQPIYGLTKGLTNQMVKKTVSQALDAVEFPADLLPGFVVEREKFPGEEQAYREIHFPETFDRLLEARNRLVYEEFFYFLLCSQLQQQNQSAVKNNWTFPPVAKDDLVERTAAALPYELTAGQRESLDSLRQDLRGAFVSQRLIQGDVGSGKTVVAFLAMLDAVSQGYQAAIMAPTEVLARQHAQTFGQMLEEYGLPYEVVCLVGSMTAREKRMAREKIAGEDGLFVVGTHALIQDAVDFRQLALVITDEQHRFGVRQRETLTKKGASCPHTAVMSATPIPRTLAMILYSNMRISLIRELPANRLPIKTCAVKTEKRPTAYRFIEREIELGHQAYVICPLVETSEKTEAENVLEYGEKLRAFYGGKISVGILHGKMKPTEKNRIMESFAAGEIQVLVSTTVVEVGVNVPNATVILIENANRFGLAALHQLRGRVGRGKDQSYCILMDSSKGEKVAKRLEILNQSNDGFYIAEQDLKLRGPGDLFGVRQSGDFNFRIADIIQDAGLLQKAAADVEKLLKEDPGLVEHPHLHEYARNFMECNTYVL